mmetsp:Transcript_15274/g.38579  ORF Transcript_15274/g.38579 Transcript_15274/m.38579 type:complete len:450 (-) Transcript_15274:354-1703(-)
MAEAELEALMRSQLGLSSHSYAAPTSHHYPPRAPGPEGSIHMANRPSPLAVTERPRVHQQAQNVVNPSQRDSRPLVSQQAPLRPPPQHGRGPVENNPAPRRPLPPMLWRGPKPKGGLYMSSADLEFVIRNLMRNMPQDNDPEEDFYFVEHQRRKNTPSTSVGVPVVQLKREDLQPASGDSFFSRLNEGALGKLRRVDLKAPRQQLDPVHVNACVADDDGKPSSMTMKRSLMYAERLYDSFYALTKNGDIAGTEEKLAQILFGDEKAGGIRYLLMSAKGRRLVSQMLAMKQGQSAFGHKMLVDVIKYLRVACSPVIDADASGEMFGWLKTATAHADMSVVVMAIEALASSHSQIDVIEIFSDSDTLSLLSCLLQKGLDQTKEKGDYVVELSRRWYAWVLFCMFAAWMGYLSRFTPHISFWHAILFRSLHSPPQLVLILRPDLFSFQDGCL